MIDPDGIQIQETRLSNMIDINDVPPCDFEIYAFEDDKEYEKFIKDVEAQVRRSMEYREFIKYLRENMNMNKCSFLKDVTNEETFDIKIEIHHYPFSLRDICEIVFRKRKYYNESLNVQMVAKEVMQLHYKLIVGLIPLSETVHELTHNGRLFIPVDKVMGRYSLFVTYYKPFCEHHQLETLERIEKYSEEQLNEVLDTTIIQQNNVSYNVKSDQFALPVFNTINSNMIQQIENIKANNYILPNVQEQILLEAYNEKSEPICPISFDYTLIKK